MKTLPIIFPELPFAAQEAFNRLRINVGFIGKSTRTIMVTGSLAEEGKSSVAVNLWRTLAQTGASTLYLDLDLRASVMLARYMSKPASPDLPGIQHYLSGKAHAENVIYATPEPNAYLIPCSGAFANPSALLEDPLLPQLLEELKSEYRYVIIDTPPLIQVSDGMRIASLCDGAILVVRSGHTRKSLVQRSVQILSDAGCPLLGTVLNRIGSASHGSHYGYGYGYGYGEKKTAGRLFPKRPKKEVTPSGEETITILEKRRQEKRHSSHTGSDRHSSGSGSGRKRRTG